MIRKINFILLSIVTLVGFGLTTFLFYPYSVNWDAGNVIENVVLGHPVYDNWMGWFYPAFIDVLFRVTHIPHAIGCLQWFIYWLAVSTLYVQLFSAERKTFLVYYLLFAFFPGALFYVNYIANSTLLYCLYLLMCSVAVWMVKKPSWWKLTLVVLLCLVCICVRRDAVFLSLPTLALVLYQCYGKFWKMTSFVLIGFVVFKIAESVAVSQVHDYDGRINSFGLIALYDQMHISRLKQELVIPDSILAAEVSRQQMLDSIMSYKEMHNDYTFYASNVEMLRSRNNWQSGVSPDPIIYLENIGYYLRFRLDIMRRYWLNAPELYNAIRDFEYRSPSYLGWVYHYFGWILYFGMPAIYYLVFGLIGLFLSFYTRQKKNLVLSLLMIWSVMLIVLMLSVTSVSSRYIYPACLCMYQLAIYVLYCVSDHWFKSAKIVKNGKACNCISLL